MTPLPVARLAIASLVWPFSEDGCKLLMLKGIARLIGLAGATSGMMGLPGNPYRPIEHGCGS
jgi:hypothetical protein